MAGLAIDRQRRDVFPQHFQIGGNQEEKLGAAGNKEAGGQVVGNQVSINERGTIWRPPASPKCAPACITLSATLPTYHIKMFERLLICTRSQ